MKFEENFNFNNMTPQQIISITQKHKIEYKKIFIDGEVYEIHPDVLKRCETVFDKNGEKVLTDLLKQIGGIKELFKVYDETYNPKFISSIISVALNDICSYKIKFNEDVSYENMIKKVNNI